MHAQVSNTDAYGMHGIAKVERLMLEHHKTGRPTFGLARPQREGAAPLVRFHSNFDPVEWGRR